MPAINTLEQFDWGNAGGAPKAQIQELAHLPFVQRAEKVEFPGHHFNSDARVAES